MLDDKEHYWDQRTENEGNSETLVVTVLLDRKDSLKDKAFPPEVTQQGLSCALCCYTCFKNEKTVCHIFHWNVESLSLVTITITWSEFRYEVPGLSKQLG